MEERGLFNIHEGEYCTYEVFYDDESFGFCGVSKMDMLEMLVEELIDDMMDNN